MKMLPLFIFLAFIIAIDIYSFIGLRSILFQNSSWFIPVYIITSILTLVGIGVFTNSMTSGVVNQTLTTNVLFGFAFAFIVGKLVLSSAFLIEDILRGFSWMFQSAMNFRAAEGISRSSAFATVALSVSMLLTIGFNYGVWFGKYDFRVRKTILEFEDLPAEFNGYTIAQLSDLHLGTFDSVKRVKKGLAKLQNENPDVILFTGDMVNFRADEVLPYIDAFAELHAPDGKYTVMGNHDYADHGPQASNKEQNENIQKLIGYEKQMGLTWLNNQHATIKRGNDSITIAGVENWGLPPFPQHGKLNEAIAGLDDKDFVVLLSHDPTHWRQQVVSLQKKIHLTLSGHTHGMQFGFELGEKLRWSPVKYRYADWAGLFEANERYMYVNRGFGSIGYPGRLGIWPEITIIELRTKVQK